MLLEVCEGKATLWAYVTKEPSEKNFVYLSQNWGTDDHFRCWTGLNLIGSKDMKENANGAVINRPENMHLFSEGSLYVANKVANY